MSTSPLRVAIVGGGIGGVAAANALLRRGMEVHLYEQAPALTFVEDGHRSACHYPATMDLLTVGDTGAGS